MAELQCFHAPTSKYKVEWIFAKTLLLLFGECKRVITEKCPANYTLWQPKAAQGSRRCLFITKLKPSQTKANDVYSKQSY